MQKGLYFRSSEIATSYGIDLIDFNNGDTVIDIGANWGDLSLFFSLNQSNLKIDYIGIEPGLEKFACLKHNLLDYSSSNYNIAVGSKNETRKFYYSPENADSSLYQPPNFTREYGIEVFTLDLFLVGLNRKYKTIKLLKIEAEGAEFDVCLGSLQILDSIEYIAADLGFEKGINQETTAPEVINFLLNHDFEICKLTDIKSLRFLFRNKKFK